MRSRQGGPEASAGAGARRWLDLLIVVGLGALALALRLTFPADGLFYDDAWQALGVVEGSLSDLPLIGQTQPGFTLELLAWTALAGTSDAALVTPALVAGVLAAPLLYAFLRRGGFAQPIPLLLAAALVAAPTHITYSTRVKSYTTDVLVMLAIALVLPRLARARWGPAHAVGWVAAAAVAAGYSSFAGLGMAGAGIILALHPNGDRRVRFVAVGAHAAVHGALLLAASQQANTRLITGFFRSRGGFIGLDPNPLSMLGNVFEHLGRVVAVYPGVPGPDWLRVVVVLAALGGLAVAAWAGPHAIRGRFFSLTLVMAMGGSVLRVVPFGAESGRVSLWTIPAVALGLACCLSWLLQLAERASVRRLAEVTALAVAVLVLAVSAASEQPPYPKAGARDAARYVTDRLEQQDVVWITRPSTFSVALYSGVGVELEATPERAVGFLPRFAGGQLVPIPDFEADPAALDRSLVDRDRVWVIDALTKRGGRSPAAELRRQLAAHLEAAGFRLVEETELGATQVDLWRLEER